jgi:hypothetical protein
MMAIVTLSRRNLLCLLAKLEIPGSQRSIVKGDGTMIVAEPDELHYLGRQPGPMAPDTESLATVIDKAVKDYHA